MTTLSPTIKNKCESISDVSSTIFNEDSTNKYMIQLKELEQKFNNDSKSNKDKEVVLKDLLQLNKNLNSIIDEKKKEQENTNKENNETTEVLKEMSNDVDNYKKNKIEQNTKAKIAEQRNKNIDIYYIVYVMFIILLLIIQSSVILFK
jgi:hypothetical protein